MHVFFIISDCGWCVIVFFKKNFMAPFYGWGSTTSRLQPLRGGSLLFTIQFPGISGTHFIDLGRMKGWVNLGTTQWFWTWDPFMFHCHFRFNSYPSVINTFINVFIKKLSEIFSFCSFEECGKEISVGLVITVIKFLTLNLTLIWI